MMQELVGKLTYKIPMEGGQSRLRELILYIADKCATDPTFGATKLNKILFWADFRSFARFGQPVTGEKYKCLELGPAPAAMVPVRREMEEGGEIRLVRSPYHQRTQDRVIALRAANLSLFGGRDIAMVDQVIEELWDKPAVEVSQKSHGIQWQTCPRNNLIPYETAYLSDEPITPGDIARTEELAREYGWAA